MRRSAESTQECRSLSRRRRFVEIDKRQQNTRRSLQLQLPGRASERARLGQSAEATSWPRSTKQRDGDRRRLRQQRTRPCLAKRAPGTRPRQPSLLEDLLGLNSDRMNTRLCDSASIASIKYYRRRVVINLQAADFTAISLASPVKYTPRKNRDGRHARPCGINSDELLERFLDLGKLALPSEVINI